MTARRGDLERAPRPLLAADVREIGDAGERFEVVGRRRRLGRVALAAEVGDGFGEVTDADRLRSPASATSAPGLGGADERVEPGAAGAFGGDERAGDGPEPPVERELADGRVPVERLGRHLIGGGEHRQRDRQVEPRPLLAQRRRRKVDRDAPLRRPLELGGRDPAADALLRLLAGAVGETDDRERRQPLLQVRLDLDAARVDADERVGDGAREHVLTLGGTT